MRLLGVTVLPAWLALIGPLHAQAPAGDPEPERPQAAAGATPGKPVEPQPPVRGKESTFNPSEKIRADSAVSFPVDI